MLGRSGRDARTSWSVKSWGKETKRTCPMQKTDLSDSSDDTAGDSSDAGSSARPPPLSSSPSTAPQSTSPHGSTRVDGLLPPPASASRGTPPSGIAGKRQAIAVPSVARTRLSDLGSTKHHHFRQAARASLTPGCGTFEPGAVAIHCRQTGQPGMAPRLLLQRGCMAPFHLPSRHPRRLPSQQGRGQYCSPCHLS